MKRSTLVSCKPVKLSVCSNFPRHFSTTFLFYVFALLAFSTSRSMAIDEPQQQVSESDLDAILAISTTEVAANKTEFKLRVVNSVPDLVPAGIKCDKIKRCDQRGVCAIVCKRGSVQMEPWLQKALALQRKLAYNSNFCSASLPGSHNSAITLADGYGVVDHIFEGYLRFIPFLDGMKLQTNNQLFSLTDQLNMGVRFIELDVHWFDGDLRIAHCGRFKSSLIDQAIAAVNKVAKLLGTGIEWDSGAIGCHPTASIIPAKDERLLKDALNELATWLHAPENSKEFLMVFIDDASNVVERAKVVKLINHLKLYFSKKEILLPNDGASGTRWPPIQSFLDSGKRVMFMSGVDYLNDGKEVLFAKNTICNWREPSLPLSPFPECRFKTTGIRVPDAEYTIFRPQTSENIYGPFNAEGQLGPNENLLDEKSLPGVTDCGVNLPSPDNIVPKRVEATVWAVTKGKVLDAGKCVALMRGSKTWQSVDCRTANLVPACVDAKNPRRWQLGKAPVVEGNAIAACVALSLPRFVYGVPASGYENLVVYSKLMQEAPKSIAGVWLNAKAFVSEVYSTK